MLKALMFSLSLIVFTSCITSQPTQQLVPEANSLEEAMNKAVWKMVSPSMVEIENYRFSTYTSNHILYCTGSGYIWDKDGYIVTNAHVVKYAASIRVVLRSGQRRAAKIVGINYTEDVAILKIETFPLVDEPLVSIVRGNSDKIFVGQTVYALGYPFGLPLSISKGIISGLCKGVDGRDDLQTDSAVNPGNSGGALVNTRGQLIGMPTYIITRSGDNSGCGFAIPVNRIEQIIGQLLKESKNSSLIPQQLFFNFL